MTQISYEAIHPHGVRPNLLVGAALLTGLGLSEVAAPWVGRRHPAKPAQIDCPSEQSGILAFGGLTQANGAFAWALEPHIGKVASVSYGSTVNTREIGALLSRYHEQRGMQSWQAVCSSLGLLTLMRSLQCAVDDNMPIPALTTIWAVSSPREPSDVYHHRAYTPLPRLVSRVGGVVFQVGGELVIGDWDPRHPVRSVRRNVRIVREHLPNMQTPMQWGSHLDMLYKEAEQLNLSGLADAGVIGDHTTVRFAGCKGDRVVRGAQAADSWGNDFGAVGATFERWMTEGAAHADVSAPPSMFWLPVNREPLPIAA